MFRHMTRFHFLLSLACLTAFSAAHASPTTESQRIEKTYQVAMQKWSLEMKSATTPEDRAKYATQRPDATAYAKEMWVAINRSLDQESTLEPAAWFLRLTAGMVAGQETGVALPIFAKENEAIRKAIESYHLTSTKLVPVCAALTAQADPRSLQLLERIESTHPDPKTQGVAALGAAIQLKTLGDRDDIMKRRLNFLRKAIIQSVDVEFNGSTVAKVAEDELYIIRFLTKGRIAPDLVGMDSAKKPLSLSANKGKVIALLFWNSTSTDAAQVIEITSSMTKRFKNRPLAVIGVNNDPEQKLRELQADGTVNWPNFCDPTNQLAKTYRVNARPIIYILDGDRKIHYSGAPGSFAELTAEALLSEIKTPAK